MLSEQQISNFVFKKESLCSGGCQCGGAYRVVTAEIVIDSQADENTQKTALVHEILGCYLGSIVSTDTLSEIAENIIDGLNTVYSHSTRISKPNTATSKPRILRSVTPPKPKRRKKADT